MVISPLVALMVCIVAGIPTTFPPVIDIFPLGSARLPLETVMFPLETVMFPTAPLFGSLLTVTGPVILKLSGCVNASYGIVFSFSYGNIVKATICALFFFSKKNAL
jgi:hypothetical protein